MADTPIDPSVSHQIYIERLIASQSKEMLPVITTLSKAVRRILSEYDDNIIQTMADANELIRRIKAEYEKALIPYTDETMQFLNKFIEYENSFETKLLNEYTVNDYDVKETDNQSLEKFVIATPMMIEKHGAPITVPKSLDELLIVANRNAEQIVNAAARTGLTLTDIKSSMLGTKKLNYVDGQMSKIYQHSKMLTHDVITHASEMIKFKIGSNNKQAVKGWRVTAVFDGKTSAICRDKDGEFISVDDKHAKSKFPPFHPKCRTIVRPVLRDGLEAIKRSDKKAVGSKTERVGSNVQYYNWLKTQDAAFQDSVLGKARGYTFRNSGLTAKQFKDATVNRMGEPLPLYKMEAMDDKILKSVEKYKKEAD